MTVNIGKLEGKANIAKPLELTIHFNEYPNWYCKNHIIMNPKFHVINFIVLIRLFVGWPKLVYGHIRTVILQNVYIYIYIHIYYIYVYIYIYIYIYY